MIVALSESVQVALIVAIPTVVGLLCTFVVSVMTLRAASAARDASTETHAIVNHRMDEFKLELQKAATLQVTAAKEAGRKEGVDSANVRTDELTAAKIAAESVMLVPDKQPTVVNITKETK